LHRERAAVFQSATQSLTSKEISVTRNNRHDFQQIVIQKQRTLFVRLVQIVNGLAIVAKAVPRLWIFRRFASWQLTFQVVARDDVVKWVAYQVNRFGEFVGFVFGKDAIFAAVVVHVHPLCFQTFSTETVGRLGVLFRWAHGAANAAVGLLYKQEK